MAQLRRIASQVVTIAILLALWEIGSGRLFDTFWYSKPSLIGVRIVQMAQDGLLLNTVVATFSITLAGFFIGSVAGIAWGVALGLAPRVSQVFAPFVTTVYNVPMLAIVPLLVLWLGIYWVAKVTIVAIVVAFLMFYNTFAGVTEVDRELVLNADLLGANRRWILRHVVLPSSYAFILAGARVALPYALVAAVVAEMMMTTGGMGALLVKELGGDGCNRNLCRAGRDDGHRRHTQSGFRNGRPPSSTLASTVAMTPRGSSMADDIIQIQGVSKEFIAHSTAFAALEDVSFAVRSGEFLSLVGPSGCGKSTLLSLIAGFSFPSKGRVLYEGAQVTGINRKVGYITQKNSLLPWRTAADNISMPLEVRGVAKGERRDRVRRYIELVNLQGFEQHYPDELSGGMRKRVALARTLIYEPSTILLDEPFGALDAQLRLVMQEELLNIWEASRCTCIFVTHDLAEAIALSDRVMMFSRRPGRIKITKAIEMTRPRDVVGMRFGAEFGRLHEELWDELRNELIRT